MGNKCVKEKCQCQANGTGSGKGKAAPKTKSGPDEESPTSSMYPELKPPAYGPPPAYAPPSNQSKVLAMKKIETKKVEFVWMIENFPVWLQKIGNKIEFSPTFSAGGHQWRLSLSCRPVENQDFIGLFLHLVGTQKENNEVFAGYKQAILNDEGKKTWHYGISHQTFNNFTAKGNWGRNKFIEKAKLLNKENGYLSKENDGLTLVTEVHVHTFTDSMTIDG